MNKIIVNNNSLVNYEDDKLCILSNKIIFKDDGEYTLEYVNSDLINLDFELLDGVMVKLFIISCNNNLMVDNWYKIGADSKLNLCKFYYNKNVLEKLRFDLDGINSFVGYNFSSISNGNEEYHIIVNHNNNRVCSNISNKCIGLDGSKIKMQIDSILDKGNVNCIMDQNSRILTLGDVDASIIPNMFIEDDDVEARHGSVVGRIKQDDIFYLMSRGICEEEAVNLVIKSLIFSNLTVDMEKRARIFQIIQELRR